MPAKRKIPSLTPSKRGFNGTQNAAPVSEKPARRSSRVVAEDGSRRVTGRNSSRVSLQAGALGASTEGYGGAPSARDKRSYGQFCGLAKALDVVGERWTLLIVRDLLLGPKRYGDILSGLDGITTNLLALRLKGMEASGLIMKAPETSGGAARAYALTDLGRELEPILLALGGWGWRFLAGAPATDRHNIAWGLFALKRRYRPVPHPVTAELRVGARVFQYRLQAGTADLREGPAWQPDFHLVGEAGPYLEWFFQGASLTDLLAKGKLAFSGSRDALRIFREAFAFLA